MTDEPSWDDLVSRLENDLRARESDSQSKSTDDEAWEIAGLLLRSRARVLVYSHSGLQPADLEDLVQNVLLKLQTALTIRRLLAARSAEGYIFVMLRNAANDLVRRRQIERTIFRSLEEPVEAVYVGSAETSAVIRQVLDSLSESDRELLRMRFWRNMTIAEIAKQARLTYSATAVRLFRLLHRLRDQLKG